MDIVLIGLGVPGALWAVRELVRPVNRRLGDVDIRLAVKLRITLKSRKR
jgi:hypothetical protein